MGILAAVIGALDPISRITGQIAAARINAQNAATEQERVAADERVKTLGARRDVLVAEAASNRGAWINTVMRVVLAAPVAVILWKVFVYDKALGQWTGGRTDALSPELWQVVMAVIGFYFLYEAARIFRR